MHNNFYLLRQLSIELNEALADFTLVSCFTQNKDELIVEFNNGQKSFFLKASLQAHFSCLSFPTVFNRARKNSADLFLSLLMKKVTGVEVYRNERSFIIHLGEGHGLLFKMHGNRANVLRVENDRIREIFRNHLLADLEIIPSALHREIDWSERAFQENRSDLTKLYFTFGKQVFDYLKKNGFDQMPAPNQWMELQKVRELLEHPTFYLIEHVKKLELTLLPAPNYLEQYARAMDGLHHFFNRAVQQEAFRVEKTSAIQALTIQIKNAEAFLKKNQLKLTELQHDLHWQQWADLVMANLHRIQPGAEQVEVENFYDDHKPLVIPLKKDLNGQRNAEVFYRKGKNQHIEVSKLSESIEKRTRDLFALKNKLEDVEGALTLQELQLKVGGLTRSKQTEPARPYHEFIFQGYKIWVGKDAQSNDELTLKLSYKDDLWLHAKDVAGSHVLIKHQAGKNFPKDVIERAAELAAYNSKRKTDTLCPVSVTPKKYVRKRKGDPAGAVIVEKEDVILVEPRLERA